MKSIQWELCCSMWTDRHDEAESCFLQLCLNFSFVMYEPLCSFNCLLLNRHEIEVASTRIKLPDTTFTWILNYSLLRNLRGGIYLQFWWCQNFFLSHLLIHHTFFSNLHTHTYLLLRNSANSWGLQDWQPIPSAIFFQKFLFPSHAASEYRSVCALVLNMNTDMPYALLWLVKHTTISRDRVSW
jgi:hypothetical protein